MQIVIAEEIYARLEGMHHLHLKCSTLSVQLSAVYISMGKKNIYVESLLSQSGGLNRFQRAVHEYGGREGMLEDEDYQYVYMLFPIVASFIEFRTGLLCTYANCTHEAVRAYMQTDQKKSE